MAPDAIGLTGRDGEILRRRFTAPPVSIEGRQGIVTRPPNRTVSNEEQTIPSGLGRAARTPKLGRHPVAI